MLTNESSNVFSLEMPGRIDPKDMRRSSHESLEGVRTGSWAWTVRIGAMENSRYQDREGRGQLSVAETDQVGTVDGGHRLSLLGRCSLCRDGEGSGTLVKPMLECDTLAWT